MNYPHATAKAVDGARKTPAGSPRIRKSATTLPPKKRKPKPNRARRRRLNPGRRSVVSNKVYRA